MHNDVAGGVPHDRLEDGTRMIAVAGPSFPRPVEIAGGGLAGLALGLALRRAGIPVTIREALAYPRHRVCGEFIAGLDARTVAALGLEPLLADALRLRSIVWFRRGEPFRRHTLPAPALGISRHRLDTRLAETFVAAGGRLCLHARVPPGASAEGRVFATGRCRRASPWVGLKVHARALPLAGDLEIHLGREAYVGLARVENNRVNVCGLFRRRPMEPDIHGGLNRYFCQLEVSGLGDLRRRLEAADPDERSFSAVAGFDFGAAPPAAARIALGDTFAMPPPFTGNGMAMALQGAARACDPMRDWSLGRVPWSLTVRAVNRRLRRAFHGRLASARLLHPFMLESRPQSWLTRADRAGVLPFGLLYRMTH